jgi:surface antigen
MLRSIRPRSSVALILISTCSISGCAGSGTNAQNGQITGMATGAVIGGILGDKVIGGTQGRIVGAVLGAVVGGMVGYEIGRSLSEPDRKTVHNRLALRLTKDQAGQQHTWSNPDTGARATYTPQVATLQQTKLRIVKQSKVKAPDSVEIVGRKQQAKKPTDFRAAPDIGSAVLGRLRPGEEILVSAKVSGKPWLMLERSGEVIGYVPEGSLVDSTGESQATIVANEAAISAPGSGTDIAEIDAKTTCRNMTFEIANKGSKAEGGTMRGCKLATGDWLYGVQENTSG